MNPNIHMEMGQAFFGVLDSLRKGCLLLIPLFMMIKTGWYVVKGFATNSKIQYSGLMGGLVIWVLVACYPEVSKYLDILCQSVVNFIVPSLSNPIETIGKVMFAREVMGEINQAQAWKQATTEMLNGHVLSGVGGALSTVAGAFVQNVKNIGENWMVGLLSIFAFIARMIIETVRTIFLQFLIAVGPLALSLSILDNFGHVLRHWLLKLVSVYLWVLTLNILDHIVVNYYTFVAINPEIAKFDGKEYHSNSPYFIDQIIVGSMYLMIPWLTSSYIGGTNAGQFLGHNVKIFSNLITSTISAAKAAVTQKTN